MEKKKIGLFGASLMLIFTVTITIVYLIYESKFMFSGEPTDIYRMIRDEGKPQEGEYVSIKVDAVVDWYSETKHTINGIIPAGKEKHCIVWLDNNSFISMTIKGKKNIEKIDKIIYQTMEYVDGYSYRLPDPVKFKGKIEPLSGEVLGYYRDAMREMGIQNAGYIGYELTLDTTETPTKSFLMFGFLILLDIGALYFVVAAILRKKQPNMPASRRPISGNAARNAEIDAFIAMNDNVALGDAKEENDTEKDSQPFKL